jgi:hypothetical protein
MFIYNCFLKQSRSGKPFKLRNNFDSLDDSTNLILTKLESFFNKFKHIKVESFFEAPRSIYPHDPYPYIDFFITRKAIKTYQLFLKQKQLGPIEDQLSDIKKTLEFITKFCLEKKIQLSQYGEFSENGYMPAWSQHYREGNINLYAVVDLINWTKLDALTFDEKEIWFPGLQSQLNHVKLNYLSSQETKKTIRNIINQLTKLTSK